MTIPLSEIVLGPGEGRGVALAGHRVTFKAVGSDTQGQVGIFEFENAPHAVGAGRHLHREMEEMFYVLEGAVEISVGDRVIDAKPGAFVLVPRGVAHGFVNRGETPARLLIIFCPGAERERYFEGMAELLRDGRTPDKAELVALMARFDQTPVE